MTLRLARRTFLAAIAATSASATLTAPPARTGGLLLLADDPAALPWLGSVAAAFRAQSGTGAAVALAQGLADAMARVTAHLDGPGARVLTLLNSPSHVLAQMALRDAGAHQYLELERAADLLRAPLPSLQLRRAMGLRLQPPAPVTLAGRSLLAGVLEAPR